MGPHRFGLNRLTSATQGNTTTTLSYDPLDRLDTYNPGSAKQYIYDGNEVAAELNSSGGIAHRYVRGDGADELIAVYSDATASSRRWYYTDQRGSVLAEADATGAGQAIYRYDEYGVPQNSNPGLFQYTGQMWLGAIGLYNYKARNYAPALGRFMQTDPIGYAAGANLYAYVGGDPVNSVDALGYNKQEIVITAPPRPIEPAPR